MTNNSNTQAQLIDIVNKLNNSLDWKTDKDLLKVDFYASGKKVNDDKVEAKLEALNIDVTVRKLRELILENAGIEKARKEREREGEKVFINLPPRESIADCDVTDWDKQIWRDVKFIKGQIDSYYVKDSEDKNTYTQFLNPLSVSPDTIAANLRAAFAGHATKPDHYVKALVKDIAPASIDDDAIMNTLPITAQDYIKIKATKYGNGRDAEIVWEKLAVPAGAEDKLYKGFAKMMSEFRNLPSHLIEKPRMLTNDPTEPAIAYIDLDELNTKYGNKSSKLWDNFLLERFHNADYVSIFKAWLYAVIVGKNNSRQEVWLYGNGGTGKGCMCKAIIDGLNELAGKDICLAASKDTGKSNFNSELLNKHFMVYADAKNLKSGMSEAKHNITGGDYMRIEGKGKEATSEKIYMKCLTCSNELPKVDTTDRSQRSRYIILPFTLSDKEMIEKGLMDANENILGSATFEDELKAEFNNFLASCKAHYEKRCPTNSNIDAHEAKEYLESITLDEVEDAQEFVETFFEITDDKTDRLTIKDFKIQIIVGKEWSTDGGAKPYADVKQTQIESYLEKIGFRKANIHPKGNHSTTARGWTHEYKGLKLRSAEDSGTEIPAQAEMVADKKAAAADPDNPYNLPTYDVNF